jgi:hypothetical protein
LSHADQRFDREGWRYGVRFHDGSVKSSWNGPTQRQRAEAFAAECRAWVRERRSDGNFIDSYTVVRHREGQDWEVLS